MLIPNRMHQWDSNRESTDFDFENNMLSHRTTLSTLYKLVPMSENSVKRFAKTEIDPFSPNKINKIKKNKLTLSFRAPRNYLIQGPCLQKVLSNSV